MALIDRLTQLASENPEAFGALVGNLVGRLLGVLLFAWLAQRAWRWTVSRLRTKPSEQLTN
jgi:hypothetical protein